MSKQSNLERIGFDRRDVEFARSDYRESEQYKVGHEDTLSDPSRKDKPLGKGTETGGHTFSVPNYSLGPNMIKPQIDTENGGGSYDIYGHNGVGGRKWLQQISLYGPGREYGANLIDTSSNIQAGQYFVS